jgi:dTDP-6-deoxy-L-talose 4-dehydrogenase (NAD+)
VEQFIKDHHLDIQLEYGKFPDRAYDSPCEYGDNKKIQKIMSK